MKAIGLKADNFKRVEAVEISFPPTGTFEVCGPNGAGKTSLLDALFTAIAGAKECPELPIRAGQRKASVELDLADYVIKREWDAKGKAKLIVTDASGGSVKSPQALLDSLLDRYAFDPMSFAREKAAAQAALLRRVIGVDFTKLDARRADLFNQRTDVNRDVKRQKGLVESLPVVTETAEVSFAELQLELSRANEHNGRVDDAKRLADRAADRLAREQAEVERLREQLKAAVKRMTEAEAERDAIPPIPEKVQTHEIHAKIAQVEATNRQARQYKELVNARVVLAAVEANSQKLTDQIDSIDAERLRILSEATMPVPGLGLDGDTVTLNGIPFADLSTSEQIKTSLAISASLDSTLRLIRIKDGSLLDGANLRLVAEWAHDHDYQVVIERVADSVQEVGVVIEEGTVKASAKAG